MAVYHASKIGKVNDSTQTNSELLYRSMLHRTIPGKVQAPGAAIAEQTRAFFPK